MHRFLPLFALAACGPQVSEDTDTDAVFGLDARPGNPTCVAFDRPAPPGAVALERAFPALSFTLPVELVVEPGSGAWIVVEKRGTVRRFGPEDDAASAEVVVDLTAWAVSDSSEMGLLGLAFDPRWPEEPVAYASYTSRLDGRHSRVVRLRSDDGGHTLNPATQEVVLRVPQPFDNHNGGQILFGPDGALYVALGDGGSGGDPRGNGQDTESLLGSVLRIDVVRESPYAIPADNPFADGVGGAPEIFAWGLRNPWKMSFDMETGVLWAGDVGQNAWEEVDRVVRGGNYGWNLKEGTHCFSVDPCDEPGLVEPVAEYTRSEGRSITGGYVYRGAAIPGLVGAYVFGDFASGRIWALRPGADGSWQRDDLLASTGVQISTFGQGPDGEILLADYATGRLFRLVPVGAPPETDFPVQLSLTGCWSGDGPTAGAIPYAPAVPFWSDSAQKGRWFALPDGQTVTVGADGDWQLPIGSVVIKEFERGGERISVRLLAHHEDGWGGYTYAWDEDGQDATWVAGGRVADVGGGPWHYPDGGECLACHTVAAGRTLGLETRQLDVDHDYDGVVANQVDTLEHIGVISTPASRGALPGAEADDEARARAWLHVNCSFCHRPDEVGEGLDLRFDTPLGATGLCAAPTRGDLGLDDARVVAPGAPARSVLLARVRANDVSRMPPVGSLEVDAEGAALLERWIGELTSCP